MNMMEDMDFPPNVTNSSSLLQGLNPETGNPPNTTLNTLTTHSTTVTELPASFDIFTYTDGVAHLGDSELGSCYMPHAYDAVNSSFARGNYSEIIPTQFVPATEDNSPMMIRAVPSQPNGLVSSSTFPQILISSQQVKQANLLNVMSADPDMSMAVQGSTIVPSSLNETSGIERALMSQNVGNLTSFFMPTLSNADLTDLALGAEKPLANTAVTTQMMAVTSGQSLPSISSIMATSATTANLENQAITNIDMKPVPKNLQMVIATHAVDMKPQHLAAFPLQLKSVTPNSSQSMTPVLAKTRDLMVYHDKMTGKKFLIPLGPAKPDSTSSQQAGAPLGGSSTLISSPNSSTGSDAITLETVNKFLNTESSLPPFSEANKKSVTSSETSSEAHRFLGISQTIVMDDKQSAQSDVCKDASLASSPIEHSVNLLKSHLLQAVESHEVSEVKALTEQAHTNSKHIDGDNINIDVNVNCDNDVEKGDNVDESETESENETDADDTETADCEAPFKDSAKDEKTIVQKARTKKSLKLAKEAETFKLKMEDSNRIDRVGNVETGNSEVAAGNVKAVEDGKNSEDLTTNSLYATLVAAMNIKELTTTDAGTDVPVISPIPVKEAECADIRNTSPQVDPSQRVIIDGKRVWSCAECKKTYSSKHNLITHMLSHSDVKPHECVICSKAFRQQSHLHTHMLTHSNIKPYMCTECGRGFTQASHLKRHSVTHMKLRLHTCGLCGRGFAFPSELRIHTERHANGKENKCEDCGDVFETLRKLKHHKTIAHKDATSVTCKDCGKVFAYPSQLRDHTVKHEGIRPYKCKKCGMGFMKEHHLKAHMFIHTDVKPYICDVCQRGFNQRANLQRHMMIHNNEREYTCDVCGRCFAQKQVLKAHMITHVDQKPFGCDVCGKRFSRAHNLAGHMHIHRGGKPHVCDMCSSSFTLRGNLTRHKKTKHGLEDREDNDDDDNDGDDDKQCTEVEAARILNELSKPRIMEADSDQSENGNMGKKNRKSTPRKQIHVPKDPAVGDDNKTDVMEEQWKCIETGTEGEESETERMRNPDAEFSEVKTDNRSGRKRELDEDNWSQLDLETTPSSAMKGNHKCTVKISKTDIRTINIELIPSDGGDDYVNNTNGNESFSSASKRTKAAEEKRTVSESSDGKGSKRKICPELKRYARTAINVKTKSE